jgi:hypothetical protein
VLQATYRYDVLGRQVLRTLVPSGVTIQSIFDSQGWRVAEYDQGTGALIREYVWLDWEPLTVIEGGTILSVRADHNGRPVLATNTSGAKVWTISFDPFGLLIASTGNPPPPASPASGSRPRAACIRTGCPTTIRQQGATSSRTPSGSSTGRASMGTRGSRLCVTRIRPASLFRRQWRAS